MGKIADILSARGELDEALRIRREEELPVYERLGDVRERAVTMGNIADILYARGDLDEALRIHEAERWPNGRETWRHSTASSISFSTLRVSGRRKASTIKKPSIASSATFRKLMPWRRKLTRLDSFVLQLSIWDSCSQLSAPKMKRSRC